MSVPYYVDVDGRRTPIRVEGNPAAKPPTPLLHGIGGSLEDLGPQYGLMADSYWVIALDIPWFGFSARVPEPATLEVFARGIERALDALDETRPVHAVGNSSACSSAESRWTVTLRDVATGEADTLRARWIVSGTGYFDHAGGHRPMWEGEESFAGTLVHVQQWPEDLDYEGKCVVVMGSGATAVPLLPALAEKAEFVAVLQRSPSYILPLSSKDVVFDLLRRFIPVNSAFEATRKANIQRLRTVVRLSRRYPRAIRKLVRLVNKAFLPSGFDVDPHLNPSYNPWEQRMCFVPDADLYGAVKRGRATIVTDTDTRFVPEGIELTSGQFLDADVVVAATGLKMLPFGGIEVTVDGESLGWSDTVTYKSVMLSGLPNFFFGFGYTNNSCTLKIDLASGYLARLLELMDTRGFETVVPGLDNPDAEREPILDDLTSNYIRRSISDFPRQVEDGPWSFQSNYDFDRERLAGPIYDGTLEFGCSADRAQLTVTGGAA